MTGPYGTYTSDPTIIADYILNKIETNKGTFRIPVSVTFYGDQDRLPSTPAVCVEIGDKQRGLEGAPDMTRNELEVFILVYHNKVQNIEDTRRECDQIAFDIEHLLHQDLQLGGLVIQGYCTGHESGYTYKANTLYRSARLTWRGINKTRLPVA